MVEVYVSVFVGAKCPKCGLAFLLDPLGDEESPTVTFATLVENHHSPAGFTCDPTDIWLHVVTQFDGIHVGTIHRIWTFIEELELIDLEVYLKEVAGVA